jgi:hypothetical protein
MRRLHARQAQPKHATTANLTRSGDQDVFVAWRRQHVQARVEIQTQVAGCSGKI